MLFLGVGDIDRPSTRYRCYDISAHLARAGVRTRVLSFKAVHDSFGALPLKAPLTYLWSMLVALRYDVIVFQKHYTRASRLCMRALKRLGKRVVYDIDDSIHMIDRYSSDVLEMVGMADLVIASSHYLEEEMRRHNPRTVRVLTPIDTEFFHPLGTPRGGGRPVIGWLGTKDNARHLRSIKGVLQAVEREHDAELMVISDVKGVEGYVKELGLRNLRLVPWSLADVNAHLGEVDVGISPLDGTGDTGPRAPMPEAEVYASRQWLLGKSATRDREYMAAGLPVVSSNVGEVGHCITDGVDGFLVNDEEEWLDRIGRLLGDPRLRAEMGARARRTCEQRWSEPMQARLYEEALRRAMGD